MRPRTCGVARIAPASAIARLLLAFAAAGWLAVAPAAHAGVIRGTLHVPGARPAAVTPDRYPGRADAMPGMHAAPRGLAGDAVISVDHVPADADARIVSTAPRPRLAQKDQSFVPRVIAIATGTEVDFPNLDPIYHNVFSLSPTRRFDLGKYPQGHSKTILFPRSGLVNVYCDIHSSMAAFILVLPHHGFTRPHADGAFALPDLPAGHYTLQVWHPDLGTLTREVDVPASGDVVLDLSF
ncbi:MAG TPA: carboxypeptidase regulatory-like domain-containing protein [Candidatus Udaeobacter sp.]|nr:carboxypeptidase regulatory-like domain-containing protein [Candidatus Udaeobacter sp.]